MSRLKKSRKAVLKAFAYVAGLLIAKAGYLLITAILSFSLMIASFSFTALSNFAYAAAARLIASPVVLSADEARKLRSENRQLANQADRLRSQNDRLRSQNDQIRRRDRQATRLTQDNQRLHQRIVEMERQNSIARTQSRQLSSRVSQRATRATKRNIAAIPAESIPIVGVSTILATTAWDIYDTCALLEDMDELLAVIGEQQQDGGFKAFCDSFPKIFGTHASHYGNMTIAQCRIEAIAAREAVFDLARMTREDIPDLLETHEDFDQEVQEIAAREYRNVTAICDCLEDLLCDLEDFVRNQGATEPN